MLLAGLVATVALTHPVYTTTPAVYSARGLVVLLPSQDTVGDGGNPFLALSGLELPARLLVAYLDSATAQAQVAEVAPRRRRTTSASRSRRAGRSSRWT